MFRDPYSTGGGVEGGFGGGWLGRRIVGGGGLGSSHPGVALWRFGVVVVSGGLLGGVWGGGFWGG